MPEGKEAIYIIPRSFSYSAEWDTEIKENLLPEKEVTLSILGSGVGVRHISKWSIRHTILDYNELLKKLLVKYFGNIKIGLCMLSLRRKKIKNDRVKRIKVLASGRQKC